jgi:hypothetical protein
MMRVAMSGAASGLLRAILNRAVVPRDRILLTEIRSVDWQSLTFVGERHEIEFRIPPPGAREICRRLTTGLSEAEFDIRGNVVVDVAVTGEPEAFEDGSLKLQIEALTIAE